jgi:hypothetical protein
MVFAVKWPPNPDVSFWRADDRKAEKSFAFNIGKFGASLNYCLSEAYSAGNTCNLPL